MTPELFREEWEGLEPQQIVDFKALAGDSSDNLTGVAGIGDKGALKIVQHFKTIEKIALPFPSNLKRYEKYFQGDGINVAGFFKKITTLISSTPITLSKYDVNIERLIARCEHYGMKSVVSTLMKK